MRGGLWVLNIMAFVWCAAGLLVAGQPIWWLVAPAIVAAMLLMWASRQPIGTGTPVEGAHVGRVVGIATAIEGVAIFLVANVLINLHMPTLVMPAIAIIVGLHFVPLARWIPVQLYYWTGAGLITVGLGAILLPPDTRATATGVAAALVLWASGMMLAGRGRG